MKKKIIFLIIIIMILILCVILYTFFFLKSNKEIDFEANKIVEAIENNDIKTVEQLLFEVENLTIDKDLNEYSIFFKNEEIEKLGSEDGIISKIIEQDSIKVKKITDKYVEYEITSPELSNIFKDAMKEQNLTTESFKEYVYKYIETADKTKMQVQVMYTYENGVFTADYNTQEFMNSLTGNLITAYQELIQQMIQENSGEGVE